MKLKKYIIIISRQNIYQPSYGQAVSGHWLRQSHYLRYNHEQNSCTKFISFILRRVHEDWKFLLLTLRR